MKIFFFAGQCLPIHARTLDERPLGGTDTAIIRVAEILQTRGYEVTVFTSHSDPPKSLPVYRRASEILDAGPCDAFIAIQDWRSLLFPIRTRARFYWTGDGAEQYVNFGIGDRRLVNGTSLFLATSDWHARHMSEETGFPQQKMYVVRNGVHLPWFEGTEPRNRKRLIYTSTPYRGLELVPGLYRELKQLHPEIELHIFSGLAVYDTEKPFEGPKKVQYDALVQELSTLPDCLIHGNVQQHQLARELMRSGLYFFPNTWRETACICCLEAKAAGVPIVTSAYGALPETVGQSGFLIGGQPGSPEYQKAFIEACSKILTDDATFDRLSKDGRESIAAGYSWEHVADRFEKIFKALEEQSAAKPKS